MLHSENTAPTSQEVAAFRRASLIACHSVGLLDCVLPLSLFHQSPIFFHDFAALNGLPHPVENHSVEEEVPCPA